MNDTERLDQILWRFARYMKRAMGGREVGGEQLDHEEARAKLQALLDEARLDELKRHIKRSNPRLQSIENKAIQDRIAQLTPRKEQ